MSDTRSQIGEALAGKLTAEQIEKLIDTILDQTKQAWGEFSCKHCGQRQRQLVEINDSKAATDSLIKLADQAWGKPQDDKGEAEGLTFVRKIVYGSDDAGTES